MYYKFDEKRLAFKKVTTKEFLLFILFFVIVTFLVSVVMATQMWQISCPHTLAI